MATLSLPALKCRLTIGSINKKNRLPAMRMPRIAGHEHFEAQARIHIPPIDRPQPLGAARCRPRSPVAGAAEIRNASLGEAVVPVEGIEPTLPCGNQILSLARLPIPPHRLV